MAGSELNLKDKNEIKRLWELGIKKRQIARATKVHRNTALEIINFCILIKCGWRTDLGISLAF